MPARLIRQWPCRAAYRSAAFKNARAGVVYALFLLPLVAALDILLNDKVALQDIQIWGLTVA